MIKELKTFIAVAREGTFTAAGDRIGLTQAAVSAQIHRLETELGVELFDRSGRSAQLNAIGLQALQQAKDLIRMYEGLGASLPGAGAPSLVAIGAIASLQRNVFPLALARFHKLHKTLRSRVLPGLSIHLLDLVDSGEIDMAVMIRPAFSIQADLRWRTLACEPYRLIVPKSTQGDDWREILSNEPFIRYDRASFGGRQVDRFLQRKDVSPREICELDELDAIVQLVENAVGVALIPETLGTRCWPAGIRSIDLGVDTFHREVGTVYRAEKEAGHPIMDFVEILHAVADRTCSRRQIDR
ncbi:LysR family transcriptional regulator [Stutzerimonas nitrititolerans]|uniref:LysR family transcriptional regulator n=1 Tax=Stutzerimonas nitrititolerans TaxID=2482751 RepID=UPI0028A9EDC7|nr:LysR family transcriptional regulator [Stutzerimonas nitrititolerans]